MTLEASVLRPDAVRATPDGVQVDVHLPWYRSLPLSCLEDITLRLGDDDVDRADLRIRHDGRDLTLDELAELVDEQWFVQDALQVLVGNRSGVAGETLDVEITLATRIPYIVIGPQTALVQRTRVGRKVVVQ
ncbi:C-glycoside deglycosidase beta subunit domain-containing protein [Pedococcus sp. P5_B7]